VTAVLAAALLFLWSILGERNDLQIDVARNSTEQALTAFVEFARSQSTAFAGTSVIGYSIGRYYGFAPAFAQISPDPERAGAMLRKYFESVRAGQPPEMPPALAAYVGVHDRFHPSFESLIDASPFDDLYLIDHAGQVVYSLRKDALFAADLTQPRYRDTPLAETFREVLARQQKTDDPQKIEVLSGLLKLDESYGALLARPVIRHDVVEGVVVFKLRAASLTQVLDRQRRAGIRVQLIDAAGNAIEDLHPRAAAEGAYGPYALDDTGWRYRLLAEPATLAGGWWYGFVGLALASALAAALSFRLATRMEGAMPVGAPMPLPADPTANGEHLDPADEHADPPGPNEDHLATDEGFRRAIVEVMTLALDYWQKTKHKGKIELAEESGLWRVYMDRSSLQTRTLDKYLLVETLPRNPRWRDVVRTAEYVIRNTTELLPEREALAQALVSLKHYLRQVERI
jgi:hypothetical protein